MNVQHSCRSDEWYTPAPIVEMARAVLGEIDLDPASSVEANATVRAGRIITRDEDGTLSGWALQSTQRYALSVGDFPFCVPRRRIALVNPGTPDAGSPSHSNAIVYVPGTVNNTIGFARVFAHLGKVVNAS